MAIKEIECINCGSKGKLSMKVAWEYENFRTAGAITTVGIECHKCKAVMMIPIVHELVYQQEEQH